MTVDQRVLHFGRVPANVFSTKSFTLTTRTLGYQVRPNLSLKIEVTGPFVVDNPMILSSSETTHIDVTLPPGIPPGKYTGAAVISIRSPQQQNVSGSAPRGELSMLPLSIASNAGPIRVALTAEVLPPMVVASRFTPLATFFVTDRQPSGNRDPYKAFSSDRHQARQVSYGLLDLSVPANHKMGYVETSPLPDWMLDRNPNAYVCLNQIKVFSWQFSFNMAYKHSLGGRASALVMIHGYNTSFADAALREAQFITDVHTEEVPLLFSWPSKNSRLLYGQDREEVILSRAILADLLQIHVLPAAPGGVDIVAHSMGALLTVEALLLPVTAGQLATREMFWPAAGDNPVPPVRNLILAAPAINAEWLEQQIPAIAKVVSRTTIYVSAADRPLGIEESLLGYARAGSKGLQALSPSVDVIDATPIAGDEHAYYAENTRVLNDIAGVLQGIPVSRRPGLRQIRDGDRTWWEFPP